MPSGSLSSPGDIDARQEQDDAHCAQSAAGPKLPAGEPVQKTDPDDQPGQDKRAAEDNEQGSTLSHGPAVPQPHQTTLAPDSLELRSRS